MCYLLDIPDCKQKEPELIRIIQYAEDLKYYRVDSIFIHLKYHPAAHELTFVFNSFVKKLLIKDKLGLIHAFNAKNFSFAQLLKPHIYFIEYNCCAHQIFIAVILLSVIKIILEYVEDSLSTRNLNIKSKE